MQRECGVPLYNKDHGNNTTWADLHTGDVLDDKCKEETIYIGYNNITTVA